MPNNTTKPPKGEYAHLKMGGMLIEKPRGVAVRLRDQEEFTVTKAQLGAVMYDDGQWGYGLVKPGKLFREFQLEERIARERGFA